MEKIVPKAGELGIEINDCRAWVYNTLQLFTKPYNSLPSKGGKRTRI